MASSRSGARGRRARRGGSGGGGSGGGGTGGGGGGGGAPEHRTCARCGDNLTRSAFSRNQWRKRAGARCTPCVAADTGGHNNPVGLRPPTAVEIHDRPLMSVGGFPGLQCCTDWPQTKKGTPPGAQSAVFNPLLACVLGPIEGHCTQTQLDFAAQWWSKALPSFSSWVERLRAAGVPALKEKLLARAKGHPNPLIHKARGHGTVPHFKGRMQNDALEMDTTVSIEIYACVQCLYSQQALQKAEAAEAAKTAEAAEAAEARAGAAGATASPPAVSDPGESKATEGGGTCKSKR